MAKAQTFTRHITHVVEEQVTVLVPQVRTVHSEVVTKVPGYVELNLKPEEASVLLAVLRRIGGTPHAGNPRYHIETIMQELKRIDVKPASIKAVGFPGGQIIDGGMMIEKGDQQ